MKTSVRELDYDTVRSLPLPPHRNPVRANLFFRGLLFALSAFGLSGTRFRYTTEGMEKIGKNQPCLILMNHSCFLDLMIASRIFFPKPYCIVCTSDGFVGMGGLKARLMRAIGCIPTRKFVTDLTLVQDIDFCLNRLHTSVLMYPEASYSFDGTATPLPRKMGVLLKKYGVPVVMVETFGAFTRNPLYNELQVRSSVPVSARVRCLFTPEEIKEKSVRELSDGLDAAFTFDQFRWQRETGLEVREPFRADGLQRILYKCAACGAEGRTEGKGTAFRCRSCGKAYTLTPTGELEAEDGNTPFPHIPDYYAWERAQVRQELLDGTYRLETDVDIAMLMDYRHIYKVGTGHLVHDRTGFTLTGCGGRLRYTQKPTSSYSLYADYYWYELGDIICIGDNRTLYYCFPRDGTPVAKARLAAEELYKLTKSGALKPTPAPERRVSVTQ